jgi:ABC-type lipoprotein release transport system permease subunit
MSAVWIRARAELRARWRASLALAMVIGLAGGLVLGAAAGARRQDSTFPLFRKAQNTAQLGIANSGASFGFANVDFAYARRLPEVTDSALFWAYLGFIKTSRGVSLTPIGDQNPVVSFASSDGRFDTVLNRMLIIEGHLADPAAIDEGVVSYLAARSYNIRVGDYLDYALPSLKDFANGPSTANLTGPHLRVRVVGIEAQSYELPPGLGYPVIHLTPAFYRAYTSETPNLPGLLLKLKHENDVPAVLDAIQKHGLLGGASVSTRVQAFNEPQNAAAVTRTVHIQAIALWLLALLAGITSLLVVGQAIIRQSFIESDENPALRALGMTSSQVFTTALFRLLIVSAAGAVIAVVVAVAVSPLTPIGLARLIDPRPGLSFDVRALLVGAAAVIGISLLLGALAEARTATRPATGVDEARDRPSRLANWLARSSFPPSSVAGVRMALETGRGRTSMPVRSTLFGAIIGLAALVTSFGFAGSLGHLLHTPRLVGWNFSGVVGDDFDAEDAARVIPILQRDPAIAEFSGGGGTTVLIGREPINVLGLDQVKGAITPVILEGRAPRAIDEIALGTRALRAIHARVGDLVHLIANEDRQYRIVGRTVIPPAITGTVAGNGGFTTFQGLRRLQPTLSEDIYLVRFAEGVSAASARATLKDRLGDLSISLAADFGDAANLQRVINLPFVLAGLLALLSAATLAHILVTAVRRRARDLAILRTLGFVGSQVRAAVAWQATTLVLLALIVGIPLGIGAGRWSWTTFSNQLGYVPEPVVRLLPILLTIPAALILGNLIAALPARAAARTRPAEVFRTE